MRKKINKIILIILIIVLFIIILLKYNERCDTGYFKQGDYCVKTIKKEKEMNFVCPKEYALINDKCVYVVEYDAKVQYSCPDNFEIVGDKCYGYSESIAASYTTTCPQGYVEDNLHVCSKTKISEAKLEYSCLSGYDYINSMCIKHLYTEKIECNKYFCYCPEEKNHAELYDSNNDYCYYGLKQSPFKTMTCPSGWIIDYNTNTCKFTEYQAAKFIYSCPSGYDLFGGNCYKKIFIDATVNYSCQKGQLENGKCIIKYFTEPEYAYICDDGYQEDGNYCVKTIIQDK